MVYSPTHGIYLVVWIDWRDGEYDHTVYGRPVSGDGQVGDEALIANTAWSDARAAYNSIDDEFLVVWADGYLEPPHNDDIYGQRLSGDSLNSIGGVINIYVGADEQDQTAIAYNPSENEYLVIWLHSPTWLAYGATYGRRLAADGDLLGSAFAIEDEGNTTQFPDLAFNAASGQYLAVWEDHRQALPRIYGQFVAADGTLVGDDFVLSDVSSDQERPQTVASGANDQYLAVWDDDRNGDRDIYGALNHSSESITLHLLRDDGQTPQAWGDLAEETLWIEAHVIGSDPPDQVEVQITAMNTARQTPLSLPYVDSEGDLHTYRGGIPVSQIVSPLEGLTAAAVVYGDDDFDYQVAEGFMDYLGLAAENRLGIAFGAGSQEGEPGDWIPPANLSFFRATGFELIKVETTQGAPVETWGFIKNQANVLLYIGHGSHSSNRVFLNGSQDGHPEDLKDQWHALDVAMLFGCSVLDIGDQSGYWDSTSEDNQSPGKEWVDLGPGHWLGFQAEAPLVKDQYGSNMIYAWASLYAGNAGAEYAWRIASDYYIPGELGMGAVANDTQIYYYWEPFRYCFLGIWPCWTAYAWRELPRALWDAQVESLEGLLASPAEAHIYDASGRHLGPNGAGGFEAEIPGSSTWRAPLASAGEEDHEGQRISIMGADLSHGYTVQLQGMGVGDMHFLLEIPDQANGLLYQAAYLTVPVTSQAVFSLTLVPATDFSLALDADGDGVFEGQVPATGVTATLVLPAGVVVAWSFEEQAGEVAHDSTVHHNDGVLIGGPLWRNGYQGGGLAFDGGDDRVQVADAASLDLTRTLTLEAWVYPDDVSGERVLFSKLGGGGGQRSYQLSLVNGRLVARLSPDGASFLSLGQSAGTVSPGDWSHVAFAYDGESQSAYYFIDGVSESTPVAPPAAIYSGTSPLYLGHGTLPGAPAPFAGVLDQAVVYRYARTDYAAFAQSDWSGGPGQAAWNGGDPTRYASATAGIDHSVTGTLRLTGTLVGETPLYSPTGVLTSSVFDAGRSVAWTELVWSATLTEGTDVQIALAVSADGLAWSRWVTPAQESGWGLNRQPLSERPVARYLRYRVRLVAAPGGVATPILHDLRLSAEAAALTDLYADAGAGADAPGCGVGSGAWACRTLRYALDERAVPGLTIRAAAGVYTETLTLKPNVSLLGAGIGQSVIDGEDVRGPLIRGQGSQIGATTIISGFTIQRGAATYGGGLYLVNASPLIQNNLVVSNSATTHGGGLFSRGGAPALQNNLLVSNTATWNGGGLYVYDGAPVVQNNVLVYNTASRFGGGLFGRDGAPLIQNNIVVSNAADRGGGVHWAGAGLLVLAFNDVWGNDGGDYVGNVDHSGDLSADPLFVGGGDYHLQPGSPCIDAGTDDGAPGADFEGDPRPLDGDGNGSAVTDVGADEFVSQ